MHTLKALIESVMAEREKRWEAERRAMVEAVTKAENANERRLGLLNEFRQQSVEEQKRFVTRVEYDGLRERVTEMQEQVHMLQAKLVPLIWVGGVLIIVLIGVFISHVTSGSP